MSITLIPAPRLTATGIAAAPSEATSGGPFAWFQELVAQVPELVQPLVIMLAGAVPFIEAEGSSALGVIGGMNPVVAALAGIVGNLLCVAAVVFVGSRLREGVMGRRGRRGSGSTASLATDEGAVPAASVPAGSPTGESPVPGTVTVVGSDAAVDAKPEKKGQVRLKRWLVKFGVPGASLLAPLALPTMFTAATLVGAGVSKSWVMLWQAIAIVLWATAVTVATTGLLSVVGG